MMTEVSVNVVLLLGASVHVHSQGFQQIKLIQRQRFCV